MAMPLDTIKDMRSKNVWGAPRVEVVLEVIKSRGATVKHADTEEHA